MTTPAGSIAMSNVNDELGKSSTASISLNDAAVRHLVGIPSGAISMNDCKSKTFYARPTGYSEIAADGTLSNPYNAVDGDTVIDQEQYTYATINKPGSGSYPGFETVRYSGFGTGTRNGYFSIFIYATCSDTGADPNTIATLDIDFNGQGAAHMESLGNGTTVTFDAADVSTDTCYGVDLATAYVEFQAMGGRVVLGDQASTSVHLYDIRFIAV